MLALRRSSIFLRFNLGFARISSSQFISPLQYELQNHGDRNADDSTTTAGSRFFFPSKLFSSKSVTVACRKLSSSSTSRSDLEEGFSELEDSHHQSSEIVETDVDVDVVDGEKKCSSENTKGMILFNVIMKAPRKEVGKALTKHVEEDGHTLDRTIVYMAMLGLRRRTIFDKALQFSEWLESNKIFEFTDHDYAARLDLIAKVHNLHRAEKYMSRIPDSFRSEVVYGTLLASYVSDSNVKKSEEVFNKIRELDSPLTDFACNQLLMLYKRLDRKKIADVLMMMEKENVKPSKFTYRLLIDTKGRSKDMEGMEQVFDTMIAEGVKPDNETLATIARYYIDGGLTEKAELILKEIEGEDITENRWAAKLLLPLYAALGKESEVGRIFKVCEEDKIRAEESLAAIDAWGKLGRVDKAEEIFEHIFRKWKKMSPRYYNSLLKVYKDQKLLVKGKDLVKRMASNGCHIGPLTWDALVRLYLSSDEVEMADSILCKAVEKSQVKPNMFGTHIALLEKYGERGDVCNAERIFSDLRKNGYTGRLKMYRSLLEAYVNGKNPAYGFRERMQADEVYPSKSMRGQLRTSDSLKKLQIVDLLD